jgi:hypothetical protein
MRTVTLLPLSGTLGAEVTGVVSDATGPRLLRKATMAGDAPVQRLLK